VGSDAREGGVNAMAANLLGRTEQSSPEAAKRCASGAGLDGEGAPKATMAAAATSHGMGRRWSVVGVCIITSIPAGTLRDRAAELRLSRTERND
jgi:hypothetical protein